MMLRHRRGVSSYHSSRHNAIIALATENTLVVGNPTSLAQDPMGFGKESHPASDVMSSDGEPSQQTPSPVASSNESGNAQSLATTTDARRPSRAGSETAVVGQTHARLLDPLYERATRSERVRAALPDLFSLAPAPNGYLPTLRNPCWKGRYRENDGKGALEQQDSLLCLPGFYIIGHVKVRHSDS